MGEYNNDKINIKIADLGLADRLLNNKDKLFLRCGSPGYIAPEILRNLSYNTSADIFSMGAVIYTIITSKGLFEGKHETVKDLLTANKHCNLNHVK